MTYSVNADGGYVAEVSYEGTAVFPEVRKPKSFVQIWLRYNFEGMASLKLKDKTHVIVCPGEALRPTSGGNRLGSPLYRVSNVVAL